MSERIAMRIGQIPANSGNGWCKEGVFLMGFQRPPSDINKLHAESVERGYKMAVEEQKDKTLTVGFDREPFGLNKEDDECWETFESFAREVARGIFQNEVALDLEPRVVSCSQTSLFAQTFDYNQISN